MRDERATQSPSKSNIITTTISRRRVIPTILHPPTQPLNNDYWGRELPTRSHLLHTDIYTSTTKRDWNVFSVERVIPKHSSEAIFYCYPIAKTPDASR